MKKIVGVIEKGTDGGYSIYADGGLPLFSHGMTETEARDSFESLVPEQAEYMKECTGEYPDWYDEDVAFEYKYDMSAFFQAFPFINATELAKNLGINPSLMRKYKSDIAKAGAAQKDMIQRKFDNIVERLRVVRF
uniref:type II toxin-antitoxin system HicB family antitoxin n=1 Tax=Prevotella sp. TaxID=59823 RepID=UPI003FF06AE6